MTPRFSSNTSRLFMLIEWDMRVKCEHLVRPTCVLSATYLCTQWDLPVYLRPTCVFSATYLCTHHTCEDTCEARWSTWRSRRPRCPSRSRRGPGWGSSLSTRASKTITSHGCRHQAQSVILITALHAHFIDRHHATSQHALSRHSSKGHVDDGTAVNCKWFTVSRT